MFPRENNPLYDVITEAERADKCTEIVTLYSSNDNTPFTVSANVAEKVKQYSWTSHDCGLNMPYYRLKTQKYIDGKSMYISLSHFLMGRLPHGMDVVDHINRSTLDNTWQNLRFATFSANMQNTSRKVNKSGFRGVIERGEQCFQAMLTYNGSNIQLGFYYCAKVAAYAYNCGVLEIHGEGAQLNDVPKPSEYTWDPTIMKLEQIAPFRLPFYSRNQHGWKGVDVVNGRYRGKIQLQNGTSIWLGTFDSSEVAAYAYNMACLELDPVKAIINDVSEPVGFGWDPIKMKLLKVGRHQRGKVRNGGQYRGITKYNDRWMACIYQEKKRIHLGAYDTEDLAAVAYNCGLKQYSLNQTDLKLNPVEMPEGYMWNAETLRVVTIAV